MSEVVVVVGVEVEVVVVVGVGVEVVVGVEAEAAVEIAALCGDASEPAAREVARVADRLVAMLTRLVRWRG